MESKITKTLKHLAEDAISTVESGYYEEVNQKLMPPTASRHGTSLVQSIIGERKKGARAIICEIKFASPSAGKISERCEEVPKISREIEAGGAVGLSVLTEPKNFNGSISNLVNARENTSLPIMMKDIIVSREQIEAAFKIGANAVLLIEEVYSHCITKDNLTLQGAIKFAKQKHLEVIVETHTRVGLGMVSSMDCDIFGINNRDLGTFVTSIGTTVDLLDGFVFSPRPESDVSSGTPLIMSESGFSSPADISSLLRKLHARGSIVPDAFLIGTSIMRSDDIESNVRRFVEVVQP